MYHIYVSVHVKVSYICIRACECIIYADCMHTCPCMWMYHISVYVNISLLQMCFHSTHWEQHTLYTYVSVYVNVPYIQMTTDLRA